MLVQTVKHKHNKSKLNDDFIQYFDHNAKIQLQEMTKTINDFMHYFQPKDKFEFSLNEIINNSISIVKPVFIANHISITYENKNTEDIIINNDMLGQVIVNILNNAKDALIENHIADKNIFITLLNRNDSTQITLEDNAGGIAKEIINKIFDPYFSTKDNKGTGLGLYMSKLIIENHYKGKLSVSNSTKGAIFTITLR